MGSVLTTALSGMLAHQQMLDVTANNLANAQTDGFKASRVDFRDQLYHQIISPNQPGGTLGGRDPSQVGQGVDGSVVSVQFTQGGIQTTGRDLDLAITGDGFFRLQDSAGVEHYTRVGNFGFDGNLPRQLVDLGTGMKVLNTNGQPITPVDTLAATATTKINMDGNLPPTDTTPLSGSPLSSLFQIHLPDGTAANGSTLLSATSLVKTPPTGPVTLNLFGTAPDGQPYSGSVTLPANATVNDLVNGISSQLTRTTAGVTTHFATASLDTGSLKITGANEGDKLTMYLGEQALPTQPVSEAAANNWQFGATTDTYAWNRVRLAPDSVPVNMSLYTADGTQHQVNGKWINTSTVTTGTGTATDSQRVWDLVMDQPVNGTLAPGSDALRGMTFNTDGSLLSPPTGNLVSNWTIGGASTVAIDTSLIKGYQGAGYSDAEDHTGYTVGTLQTVSVDQNGVLEGHYSNDQVAPMSAADHQIGMTVFSNPDGLLSEGGNLWAPTVNSGAPANVAPGSNGTNTITSDALETSNVDLTEEFTKLLIAQRGFQSNSKAFQTGDEMLTEAFTLFR